MGEIRTAQCNMETRCKRQMGIVRDLIENRSDYTHEFESEEIDQMLLNAQDVIRECIETNIINRRIRSCGQ